MTKNTFDQKFGSRFLESIPLCAGVYEMIDDAGQTIYVGKSKHLRRRLQQYKNAKRCKKHRKMKIILTAASSIKIHPCANDTEALLLENQLIQAIRPRFNISGAFSFLYPLIGMQRHGRDLTLLYTTTPEEYPAFEWFGAYRSRDITQTAHFSLVGLLGHLGHREPFHRIKKIHRRAKYSHLASFRQIDQPHFETLSSFLRGDSTEFLQTTVAALLEKRAARQRAEEVQEWIDNLLRFFKFEARSLKAAMEKTGFSGQFVPQKERDRVFIFARHRAST